MRKFDIPYNFQDDYFEEFEKTIKQYPDIKDSINSIYIPCFIGDCQNSREAILGDNLPKTWEEYLKHIQKIQSYNIPIYLLLQKLENNMEIIDKYYNLGIRIFCINNDELSKAIKEKYDNVYIILSITRNSTIEEIMNFDIYTYDKICLPFEFNRKLDLVEQLSDKFEYSILCNSSCLWNCKECQNHWFHRGKENLLDMQYKKCRKENISSQQRIYISPVDLSYFDCKINSYKLLDRVNPSLKIFSSLISYAYPLSEMNDYPREYYTINEENGNS